MIEQDGFAYRLGWGPTGLSELAPHVAVVVIVDVLRFTSAVSAAVEAGAAVVPARWADEQAAVDAATGGAVLAGRREDGQPSLSPTDLLTLRAGTRLVLPSPNGATIAVAAADHPATAVLAGCLRNATATARRARELAAGGPIGIVAAGERYPDDSLRHAVEDLLGAGAVLAARPLLRDHLLDATSGRELAGLGFTDDVHTAAELDAADVAAQLVDGAFTAV